MAVVSITGPYSQGYMGSASTTNGGETGKGFVIGDGYVLTAGHVIYEWNRVSGTNPSIVNNPGYAGKIIDYRGYATAYASQVASTVASLPTGSAPPKNVVIEGKGTVAAKDTAVLSGQSGSTGASDAGLVLFASASDLTIITTALDDSAAIVKRYAQTTVTGTISAAANGRITFSQVSALGDSGGAYVLSSNGNSWVIGTHSGNYTDEAGNEVSAAGTYFTPFEWSALNNSILAGKTGNLSSSEPTNMIVGTSATEALSGSARADIILGRAGADTLDGGDAANSATVAWGNDQLFGGAGNDIIKAGYGADLFHGGDRRSTVHTAAELASDGSDTVDYSLLTAVDPTKGVKVILGGATPPVTTWSANKDIAFASYVTDLGRKFETDTLISIEKIVGTSADDIVRINSLDAARLSNSSHQGGLDEINLGGHSKGDLVDFSGVASGVKFDMSITKPFASTVADTTSGVSIIGAEQVIGTIYSDQITGSEGNDVISARLGGDTIRGMGGADLIFSDNRGVGGLNVGGAIYGGDGDDQFVIKGAALLDTGTGADIIYKVKSASNAASGITLAEDHGGTDKIYWNGYLIKGASSGLMLIDGDNYGDDPAWLGDYAIVYDYGYGDLNIHFPWAMNYDPATDPNEPNPRSGNGSDVITIKNFANGDYGVIIPGFDTYKLIFDKMERGEYVGEPFSELPKSNIYDNGTLNDWYNLPGWTSAYTTLGPQAYPVAPTSTAPATPLSITGGSSTYSSAAIEDMMQSRLVWSHVMNMSGLDYL